jgi:hypothetical protein
MRGCCCSCESQPDLYNPTPAHGDRPPPLAKARSKSIDYTLINHHCRSAPQTERNAHLSLRFEQGSYQKRHLRLRTEASPNTTKCTQRKPSKLCDRSSFLLLCPNTTGSPPRNHVVPLSLGGVVLVLDYRAAGYATRSRCKTM